MAFRINRDTFRHARTNPPDNGLGPKTNAGNDMATKALKSHVMTLSQDKASPEFMINLPEARL